MWRRFRWFAAWMLAAALVLSGAAPVSAPAEPKAGQSAPWTTVREHWYVLELGGAKAGWRHDLVETNGSMLRSSSQQRMSFARAGEQVDIQMSSVFEETQAGEPVRVVSKQRMAKQEMEQEWVFTPEGIEQTGHAGGQRQTKKLPLPEGEWLTPGETERFVKQRLAAGAERIEYRSLMPETGVNVIDVTNIRVGAGEMEMDGRRIPVTHWKATTSVMPIEANQTLSADGVMLREEVDMGIGLMVLRQSSRDEAMAESKGPAPDVFQSTFVKPDRPIPQVMNTQRIEYRLKTKKGQMPDLPTAGAQTVAKGDQGQPTGVIVDVGHVDGTKLTAQQRAECLESNMVVDSTDALIRKLVDRTARQAGEKAGEREKAEAMRQFVHRHISLKGFDTAFASASETARTQAGDCSEHAVLLCAMLRAAGIPSRTAGGLLYIDHFAGESGVFGWHMWTQAYVDGGWIDLDATLDRPYHAGHILTSISTMSDRGMNLDMASIVTLVGNIEIDVVKINGETKP